MSHSTEIKVEIGLDSHYLHCGSRHPAEYCGGQPDQDLHRLCGVGSPLEYAA